LSVPAPDKYELKFNSDFKLPDGIDWSWDANDPLIAQARDFANASGMGQEAFSKLLGLHAASRVSEMQMLKNAHAAEVAKLGATGNARVDAVKTWLTAMGGADAKSLTDILTIAPVAGTIKALENLMQKFTSQGAGSFSGANREGNQVEKLTDAQYAALTYSERKEYAAKHSNGAVR
jgi:hypothetical protein